MTKTNLIRNPRATLAFIGKKKGLQLQERDVFQLLMIYDHLHISSKQLDALTLHRYPTIMSKTGTTTWDAGAQGLKRRRERMRTYGLLDVSPASQEFNRRAFADLQFFITHKGYRVLCGVLDRELRWTKRTFANVSPHSLGHYRMLNTHFVCKTIALEHAGGSVQRWRQDARIFEKVRIPPYEDAEIDTTQLQPDAFDIIARPNGTGHAGYIEVDRSGGIRLKSTSRPAKSMLQRFRRYWHHQRTTGNPFVVYIETTNKTRTANMQALICEHEPWVRHKTGLFWFKTVDYDLDNPGSILGNWQTAWGEQKNMLTD